MLTLLWIVAIFLGIGALAYNSASIIVWTIAAAVGLFVVSIFSPFHMVTLTLMWCVAIALSVVLNASPLRRDYLSKWLFKFYAKIGPKMSKTEKEALDAGTVKWAGELVGGSPNWQGMLDRSGAVMSDEEQAFLNGPVEELCCMIDDWDITHSRSDLPPEIWTFLKEKGFFGIIIPKSYGGLDFSATAHSNIVAKVGAFSVTAAVTIAVPNSLGPAELLLKYGTEKQKNHYLPCLAKGDEIPCFALTGPEAGSDATSLPDTGIVCMGQFEGREVMGLRLNFNKRYITLAPVATVIGLAFRMFDPEHLLDEKEEYGITCALIPRETKGMVIGRRHFPLNSAFLNGPIQGKDVFIPLEWIIGGVDMAGHGWTMLVECLSVGRGISLPAITAGGAKLGMRTTSAYSRIRHQFGLPIGKFEGIEEVLARAAIKTYILDSTREMTLAALDRGEVPAVLTAITKCHVTEMGRMVSNDVMDIHGGKGICLGPRNYLGRAYQALPISITVEGANILTRSMIIFGQGIIRCHPYIETEMNAVANPDKKAGLKAFDAAFFAHLGHIFTTFVKSLGLGLTSSRIVSTPKGSCRRYFQHLTRFSAAFAFLSEMTMATVGGELKRKESLSGRLGDILSLLYMGSAILKRFHDDGAPKADEPFMHAASQDILYQIQEAIDGVIRNFPNRMVAVLLRATIFPLGRRFHRPSDRVAHEIVQLLLEPSETRDRLTRGLCLSLHASHPVGRIDEAMRKVIAIKSLEQKIREAVRAGSITGANYDEKGMAAVEAKLITEEEYHQLVDAHAACMEVIHVDDFDASELSREHLKAKSSSKRCAQQQEGV